MHVEGPVAVKTREPLSGWGRYPVERVSIHRPATVAEAAGLVRSAIDGGLIARGLGRAYGDSALCRDGGVAMSDRLDSIVSFDDATGTLEAEAGLSFAEIIRSFLPRGWFLPTTPGTKFVTVGGAVAADVHGKNHHRVGSFGEFVDVIELVVGDGSTVRCSRQEHPDLFFATLGGMGLTGFITRVRFRLVRVETSRVTVAYRKARDLDHALAAFEEGDRACEHSVAWIDCMAGGSSLGRSVIMQGNATRREELSADVAPLALPPRRTKCVPFTPPVSLLAPWSVRAFNTVFYAAHADTTKIVDIESFFYPLDAILHWNRLYGPRGFVQYQAFFPRESSRVGLVRLLECIVASGAASFLAVLKSCGYTDGGLLSYLAPGHTLALDIPWRPGETDELCRRLDAILLDHGGRLYLAKDALMTAATFRRMYPRLDEFLEVKRRYDPGNRFVSSQAVRLGIV
jgi:decaprenylphospho-beta-D-ribofuranose 2-oxidase